MAVQRRKPVPKELVWIQLRLRGHVPAQLARALAGALGLKTMVIIIIVVVCCACENVKRMPQATSRSGINSSPCSSRPTSF